MQARDNSLLLYNIARTSIIRGTSTTEQIEIPRIRTSPIVLRLFSFFCNYMQHLGFMHKITPSVSITVNVIRLRKIANLRLKKKRTKKKGAKRLSTKIKTIRIEELKKKEDKLRTIQRGKGLLKKRELTQC